MSFTIPITRFSIGVSTNECRSELHISVSELPASKLSVLRLVVILGTGTGTKIFYTQNICMPMNLLMEGEVTYFEL